MAVRCCMYGTFYTGSDEWVGLAVLMMASVCMFVMLFRTMVKGMGYLREFDAFIIAQKANGTTFF